MVSILIPVATVHDSMIPIWVLELVKLQNCFSSEGTSSDFFVVMKVKI